MGAGRLDFKADSAANCGEMGFVGEDVGAFARACEAGIAGDLGELAGSGIDGTGGNDDVGMTQDDDVAGDEVTAGDFLGLGAGILSKGPSLEPVTPN